MNEAPIRRRQLITTSGVGSMITAPDGTSLLIAGLDHWYERPYRELKEDEFVVREWRLERLLGVSHFRLPPDFRKGGGDNLYISIPALRFPRWHRCILCNKLVKRKLTDSSRDRDHKCPKNNYGPCRLYQVPMVAVCPKGHMEDFPFVEWVHRTLHPTCQGPLKMYATGTGFSLGSIEISCEGCGKKRTLYGLVGSDVTRRSISILGSKQDIQDTSDMDVEPGKGYTCRGHKPWLGDGAPTSGCGLSMSLSMSTSTNVYFPNTIASLFIPKDTDTDHLRRLLESPSYIRTIETLLRANLRPSAQLLRGHHRPDPLEPYTDEDIDAVLEQIIQEMNTGQPDTKPEPSGEASLLQSEYQVLSSAESRRNPSAKAQELITEKMDLDAYDAKVAEYLESVVLVKKLRVTRVFVGFSRYESLEIEFDPSMLWRNPPDPENRWLPADVSYGEGIFLALNSGRLQQWESAETISQRVERIKANLRRSRGMSVLKRHAHPRHVLLHTLAHLLMRRLAFESGYSLTSLHERIYSEGDMAGILIYTSEGDVKGTLGGLVRMGLPQKLEGIFLRALEEATWCSSDPVCMESVGGDVLGLPSFNLAACHACALLPETSCQEMNHLLDRALVVGTPEDQDIGFFKDLVKTAIGIT